MNTRLGTVKRSRWRRWRKSMFISGSALFLFLTSIQNLIKPTPMNDGVGIGVTVVNSDMHYYTGHVSALGGTQDPKSGGTGGYASLSV